jgi:hypothetical protein
MARHIFRNTEEEHEEPCGGNSVRCDLPPGRPEFEAGVVHTRPPPSLEIQGKICFLFGFPRPISARTENSLVAYFRRL